MNIAKLIKSINEELSSTQDIDFGLDDSPKNRLGDNAINKAEPLPKSREEDPEVKIFKQKAAIAQEKYKLMAQKLADVEENQDENLFKSTELQNELDSNQKDVIINSINIMQSRMNQKKRNDLPPDANDALILTALKTAMKWGATRPCPHCGQKPDVESGMNEFNKN